MIFQTFPPTRLTYRSPAKIRRALPDRQIQPFDERSVQRRGIIRLLQPFLEARLCSNHRPPFHLDHLIVSTRFDDLTINAGRSKDLPDDPFIELESVCRDQRKTLGIGALGYILEERQRIFVTPPADNGRRPQSGPDLDGGEDPSRLLLPM